MDLPAAPIDLDSLEPAYEEQAVGELALAWAEAFREFTLYPFIYPFI